jgi:hypothetical protein
MWPKDNNKKVSAAVRILHQKRDASARATHLKATNEIVSLVTIERKTMSTKTSFKRIALVAAASLALGGVSVITATSASAGYVTAISVSTESLGKGGAALTASQYTTSKVVSSKGISAISATVGDTITLAVTAVGGTFVTSDTIKVVNRGYGNLVNATAVGASIAAGSNETVTAFTVPAVAGTYTLDVTYYSGGTSSPSTDLSTSVTLTVAAAATYSNSYSTALIASGVTAPTTTTNALAVSATKTMSANAAANILVSIKDTTNTALDDASVISATISGSGYIAWDSASGGSPCSATPTYSALIGRSITAQAMDDSGTLYVCSDNTSGTGTITISVTDAASVTSTLATKTVTFYGAVASMSVHAKNFTIGTAGGGLTGSATGAGTSDTITYMPAFVIAQKDSSGQLATGATPTFVITGQTVIASGVCAQDNDADYGTGATGYFGCSFTTSSAAKSGDKVTITLRIADPADSTKYLTTTVDLTVGGSVAKEVISFDKPSYSAGEAMQVTITATDSSGNPVADGKASPALTGSKATGGSLPAASYYVGGKKATTAGALWAPAIGGDFTVVGTGTDAAATALSATVSVSGDESASLALDAANAATDAANNAYDEAQNATQAASDALAAVTALAAQVKSLIASVKKLTAAVAKLKK